MAFVNKTTKNINGVNITLLKKTVSSESIESIISVQETDLSDIRQRMDDFEELISQDVEEVFETPALSFNGVVIPYEEDGGAGIGSADVRAGLSGWLEPFGQAASRQSAADLPFRAVCSEHGIGQ